MGEEESEWENTMLDQTTFTETVREVSEIIRTSSDPLTKEQILAYFSDMELNEEQQELVINYLLTPQKEPVQQELEEPETEETEESGTEGMEEDKKTDKNGANLPDSRTFRLYLEELQGIPAYSEAELDKLYERLLAGEEAVIKLLADAWLLPVLNLAKELAVSKEDFEDIVQEGNVGLFIKLTELCGAGDTVGSVGEELRSAARLAMQTCILELAGEDDSESAMLGKVNLVNEARKYLAEQNGTEPTPAELDDYTKMPEEELSDILRIIQKSA